MDAGLIIGVVIIGVLFWSIMFKIIYDRVVQKESFVQNGWNAK